MIGRLTGKVVEDASDGSVTIDVGGVGYELTAPLGSLGRAPVAADGAVSLFVHTHVREDALSLFGFATREDRAAFRSLIAVANVGPKIAVAILSALTANELAEVIRRGEASRLTAIPGIGKKTAERLVLELKDKLHTLPEKTAVGAPARPAPSGAKGELLQQALTRLGFKAAEAERAVATLGNRVEAEPLADLVRDALASLAR